MKYKELLDKLGKLPSHKLEDDVSIYSPDGEFYSLHHVAVSNDNGVLDEGHIYLSADEILYEDDYAI